MSEDEERWWEYTEWNLWDEPFQYSRKSEWRDVPSQKPMREWQLYAFIGSVWASAIAAALVVWGLTRNSNLAGLAFMVGFVGAILATYLLAEKYGW